MKTNQWGKTLLYTYKYLNRITDAIDKMVDQAALNSFYYSQNSQRDTGVLAVTNKIISLIERKKRLVNIKVLVDKALEKCDDFSGEILVQKYMDNRSSEEIAQWKGLNIRTYFRKLVCAEANFCANMARMGYDEKTLENYLCDEKWIFEIYEQFKSEEKNIVEKIDEEMMLA